MVTDGIPWNLIQTDLLTYSHTPKSRDAVASKKIINRSIFAQFNI